MNIFKHFVVCSLLCSYGCYSSEDEGIIVLTPEQISEARIETKTAEPHTLQILASIPGKITINQNHEAHVVAKASGIVTKILKNIGEPVREGEIIAIVESKEMAEAKAAYITALKRETLAAQTIAAEEILKNKNITSQQDYLHTLLAAKEALINLEVAAQQLYILGLDKSDIKKLEHDQLLDLRTYEMKSPITGVVTAKNINLGELIQSDKEVFVVADLDTVWIELGIYPKDLEKVKIGSTININLIGHEQPMAEAVVTQLSPTIDENTRTASAIAVLPNISRKWFPGSYVNAHIVVEERKVPIAVLKSAVHDIDGDCCLFIPHEKGFEKRTVDTGKTDGQYVEILSGLEQGMPYAATQTYILKADLGKSEVEAD